MDSSPGHSWVSSTRSAPRSCCMEGSATSSRIWASSMETSRALSSVQAAALRGPWTLSPRTARIFQRLAYGVAALYGLALLAMVFGPHKIGDVFAETDFYGGYAE